MKLMKRIALFSIGLIVFHVSSAQQGKINWTADGLSYTKLKNGDIIQVDPATDQEKILVTAIELTPAGDSKPLSPQSYVFSNDLSHLLLFVNTAKVWRYNTRGDYWVLDLKGKKLVRLGAGLPARSLMFAKFSPDNNRVAYVSERNLYVEDLAVHTIKKLTMDGTRKLINGTFDWVYEEEFGCRDGFRWSPDSRHIAFWQVDATQVRDFFMINNTDSVYSRIIPVEYPKVGEPPSPVRIGVVSVSGGVIRWMKLEGDPRQHYIPRMEWSGNEELVVQQLDRKQQESKLVYCKINDGGCRTFWAEQDDAWVDLNADDPSGWNWVNKGRDFLWVSEKDGWRHIYKISRDGKNVQLLTRGNYDIGEIKGIDEINNHVYFSASPRNATQLYLLRVRLNPSSKQTKEDVEWLSDSTLKGTHKYQISPGARMAMHAFGNHKTPSVSEWISLPDHKPLKKDKAIASSMKITDNQDVEYFQLVTEDNILLDGWINKPKNFDPSKKYPLVLYVYGEPATSTVNDEYGRHSNFLYDGDMRADGYIQASIDNRGTPSLKGAGWRKAIYRQIGRLNIRDLAMATKKLSERPYVDKDRMAVWGWSGGGASTLNLLFQFPELFQTGISIASITNQLFYDNIYQERYMGLPQENLQDFIDGSPVTHAKGLKGKLLYIHGTGDDNVHYSNAELLINELIKQKKQFEFMAYPNRSHSIREGEGTTAHMSALYTAFLRKSCPPGAR
jgi:dipeptidyl-peptidase-4